MHDERADMGHTHVPYHIDDCNHGLDCWVGSFQLWEVENLRGYDVYLYGDNEICIRCGRDGAYASVGHYLRLIQSTSKIYHAAWYLLMEKYKLKLEKI